MASRFHKMYLEEDVQGHQCITYWIINLRHDFEKRVTGAFQDAPVLPALATIHLKM